MTSKVSWYKMVTNAMKRRLWYGAIVALTFFLSYPLNAMVQFASKSEIENIQYYNAEEIQYQLHNVCLRFQSLMAGGEVLPYIAVLGVALLGAWSGLYWLHSKKKMDLIGSLPVRREKIFLAESISTLLLFFIPYLVNVLLALVVGASKEILTGTAVRNTFLGMGIHLFFYVVLYLTAAAAMLLTGKILTGILGTLVFLAIGPAIYGLYYTLPQVFWKTYISTEVDWMNVLLDLSPAAGFLSVYNRISYWASVDGAELNITAPMVTVLITGIVMGILCFWLVKKRPSEGAESSMAFPATEGVIKAIILYPLSLAGGLFFQALGDFRGNVTPGTGWFWFGIVFTLLLGSIIIEVIYHFDRKMIFARKKATSICTLAVLATAAFFDFDLIGYDRWIPEQEEVTNAIVFDWISYSNDYPDGSKNSQEYLKNHMEELNSDSVLEMVREAVENLGPDGWQMDGGTSVTALFRMKDGKIKARNYVVSEEMFAQSQRELYEQKLYRETLYPLLLTEPENVRINDTMYEWGNDDISLLGLTGEEQTRLIAIYQEELSSLSYDEIVDGNLYGMYFRYREHDWYISGDYQLNEHFVKTIKFLTEKGVLKK